MNKLKANSRKALIIRWRKFHSHNKFLVHFLSAGTLWWIVWLYSSKKKNICNDHGSVPIPKDLLNIYDDSKEEGIYNLKDDISLLEAFHTLNRIMMASRIQIRSVKYLCCCPFYQEHARFVMIAKRGILLA